MITGEEFSLFTPVLLPSKPPPHRGHRWNARDEERLLVRLHPFSFEFVKWRFLFLIIFFFLNNSNFIFEYFLGRVDEEIWGVAGYGESESWKRLYVSTWWSDNGPPLRSMVLRGSNSRLRFKIHLDTSEEGGVEVVLLDSPLNLIRSRA